MRGGGASADRSLGKTPWSFVNISFRTSEYLNIKIILKMSDFLLKNPMILYESNDSSYLCKCIVKTFALSDLTICPDH